MEGLYPRRTIILFLLVVTAIFYYPTLQNKFVNWDDTVYVIENEFVQKLSVDNLKAIFTRSIAENYHPLTFVSLALDYAIAGTSPAWYHLVNLLLHLVNTLLVFQLIFLLTGRGRPTIAFLTALLFAIHPMHVEAVAWVTGRKDLLFSLFYLAGLIAYFLYLEKGRTKWLIYAFLLCVCSLLSKPAAVSFFLVLPLIDYWRGRGFGRRQVLEKLPFALACAAIGAITFMIQADSSVKTLEQLSVLDRVNFTAYGIVVYLVKVLFPINLSPFHSYPDLSKVPVHFYYMPFLALGLVGGMVWLSWKRTWRVGLFGIMFFLVTLSPTMQLLAFGESIVSERYTYLPYIGLFFMLAGGLSVLADRYVRHRMLLVAGTAVFCTLLATVCFQQTKVWRDGISLWTAAISSGQYPSSRAYTNRGTAYAYAEKFELALEDFNQAKELNQNEYDAYHNTGIIYYRQNRLDEALQQLNYALQLSPLHPNALGNRGHVHFKKNDLDNAIRDYTGAINGNPYNPEIYNMRGFILFEHKRQYRQAIEDFDNAIRINPSYVAAYVNRAKAHLAVGNAEQAEADLSEARRLGFEPSASLLEELARKPGSGD
jgi:Flp pilus assembly protein TadD